MAKKIWVKACEGIPLNGEICWISKPVQLTKNSISIDTTIHSSIEKVWEAWTDPDIIIEWFGSDPNGKGLEAQLDVQPGGRFEVTFNDSDQAEHTCSGIYKEVEELRKLTFSWMWKSEPGAESFVTVLLYPQDKNTKMLFEHSNLDPASKHGYLEGWKSTFLKLERILTGKD